MLPEAPLTGHLSRRRRRQVAQAGSRRPVCYARPTSVTPRGREAGENPAQSRYGDRPKRAQVRSPTHGACSNLREKGRQDRALHRLDPSVAVSKRGVRAFADPSATDPSAAHPSRRSPTRVPVPVRAPCRGRAPPLARALLVGLPLLSSPRLDQRRRTRRPDRLAATPAAPAPPRAAPTPAASPTPRPVLPASTLTDDEGDRVTLAAEPQKIVSLTPAVTETLFAVGAGDRVCRHRRLERLPGRGRSRCPMS